MWIRHYAPQDAAACANLFYRAVREGAAPAYSPDQLCAWAPCVPDAGRFHAKLAAQTCFVAETDGGLAGFMSLTDAGHIDMAFVAPEAARGGVGSLLYAAIVNAAALRGHRRLTADASLLARPFFERHGWQTTAAQTVQRRGETLRNFAMHHALGAPGNDFKGQKALKSGVFS